ncbi:MAG: hypothetical protein ACRC30_08325 [Clostridium sp.]
MKSIGIEGLKFYEMPKRANATKSPYSEIVDKFAFVDKNTLTINTKDGVIEIGEISLDEAMTYKKEIILNKSDVGFELQKEGINFLKAHHLEMAYHKALSLKLNAIPSMATNLIELLSKAPIYKACLFVSLEDFKTLQALTPATTPKGLENLEVLVIEGLTKPCICSLEEIGGKCIVDFKQCEQDTELTRKGVEKWFLDVYLGINIFGTVIK